MSSYIGDGQFEYITDSHSRKMLQNAFQAISQTEMWHYVVAPNTSFMFDDSDEINIINRKMNELGDMGHSGFSYGWTMRNMQTLATIGEAEFKKYWVKSKSPSG